MSESTTTAARRHQAGLFDIRNIIGGLIGVYGVILLLLGLFGDEASGKTGGVNANLWAGLVMIVFGIVFITWATLRPVRVPEQPEGTGDGAQGEG